MSKCHICKREMDNPLDPTTANCGGDCLRCMADIGEDPDCMGEMYKITRDKKYLSDDSYDLEEVLKSYKIK